MARKKSSSYQCGMNENTITALLEMVLGINSSTYDLAGRSTHSIRWSLPTSPRPGKQNRPLQPPVWPTVCRGCQGITCSSPDHIYISNISLAKNVVLTDRQAIKNPSHPKGVVSESNLSCCCGLQLAQIHLVSTSSHAVPLHLLLLLNWRALYFLSSTDICKTRLGHFT